jgi:hypothetical protein
MAPVSKGPPPRDRLCGNCLYFKADEAPEVGECRLNPPQVLYDAEDGCFAVYPIVAAAEDWCGQHRGAQ